MQSVVYYTDIKLKHCSMAKGLYTQHAEQQEYISIYAPVHYANIHICTYMHTHMYLHAYTYVLTCIHIYAYIHMDIHVCSMYLLMYICMCVHTHTCIC